MINLLKQLKEIKFGIFSVFHFLRRNRNLNLIFLSKWAHLSCVSALQTSPYLHYWWSFSTVHIKVPWLTYNFPIFSFILFYFIVILIYLWLISVNLSNFPGFDFIFCGFWICRQNWSSLRYQRSDTEYKSALYLKLRKSARS